VILSHFLNATAPRRSTFSSPFNAASTSPHAPPATAGCCWAALRSGSLQSGLHVMEAPPALLDRYRKLWACYWFYHVARWDHPLYASRASWSNAEDPYPFPADWSTWELYWEACKHWFHAAVAACSIRFTHGLETLESDARKTEEELELSALHQAQTRIEVGFAAEQAMDPEGTWRVLEEEWTSQTAAGEPLEESGRRKRIDRRMWLVSNR
jgi:hypothetical protein